MQEDDTDLKGPIGVEKNTDGKSDHRTTHITWTIHFLTLLLFKVESKFIVENIIKCMRVLEI